MAQPHRGVTVTTENHTPRSAFIGLPGIGAADNDWRDNALCAQTDPEAFYPEKGGSTKEAKRICTMCSVRTECLEEALANDERFGIRGGLSERERRRLHRYLFDGLSAMERRRVLVDLFGDPPGPGWRQRRLAG
jgi:WhiB family transcriptional regulator, redox-sensing transcriptional regulator